MDEFLRGRTVRALDGPALGGDSLAEPRPASPQSPDSEPVPAPAWTGWLVTVMALTVALYAVDVILHPLGATLSGLVQKFGSCSVFIGAGVLCLTKARSSVEERSTWRLLALAMLLWGLGGTYYAIVLWDLTDAPIPSLADGFWLAFYLPAYAALYKLLRAQAGKRGGHASLDALVAGLGIGGAAATVAFGEVLKHHGFTSAAGLTNLAYPLGDLGLLAMVVAAITMTGWKGAGVWRWIGLAFVVFAVSDSFFLLEVAEGDYTGGVLDLGWPVSAMLVGFAAWRPGSAAAGHRSGQPSTVVPALSGLAALVLLVVDHFVRTNPLALALSTASILVIIVRLRLAASDNARMLAESRVEATTDALTGLSNRRRLMSDLTREIEALDPARPVMLTLYDLDGFKHYNDTFGHVAGDQLLERLSKRLAATMGSSGTAYRMGGDEFCTLLTVPDPSHASALARDAVAALSEEGEAFSIGSSHGSVLLPDETRDPVEALRLADRRMYMLKGRGRASAGRQSSDVLLTALAERDASLGVHLDDVADLVCATAEALGVPRDDMELARQTALLHDVGKFAIPEEILHKPGPLDDAEWAFMKRHTIIGERIILAAPSLTRVARLVRSTHECFDGTGYPDGLAGDAIPLIARIVIVCDAYDAMVTDRPYRSGRTSAVAVAELRRCAGTQFDPEVVDAFVVALESQSHIRPVSVASHT